ncbi:hypothetical protein [Lacticaseibacillus mingshuiensis]|uniref:hypothetical protein n=1 Tax=Lacticaseibacillus mingshuiensis TaxID=2799574 RepID=UPI00194EF8CE|nr:hypothetical protein [Lacticaseibacillus mingshuiensis]
MDYFKQRRAFRKLLTEELELSLGQVCLYRELLDYANDEGKMEHQFRLRNSIIASRTGLTEEGVKAARNRLVQEHLIEYTPGSKSKKSPGYKLVQLYGEHPKQLASSTPDNTIAVPQATPIPVPQTTPHKYLPVLDYDLTIKNTPLIPHGGNERVIGPAEEFVSELWPVYPRKGGNFAQAQQTYVQAVTSGETTKAAVLAKIAEYKAYIALNHVQTGFIKTAGNWFEGHGWMSEYDTSKPAKLQEPSGRQEATPGWLNADQPATGDELSTAEEAELAERMAKLRGDS